MDSEEDNQISTVRNSQSFNINISEYYPKSKMMRLKWRDLKMSANFGIKEYDDSTYLGQMDI